MRIAFALPGLHRVHRGAEVAFIAVASELARRGDEVTLFGSGPALPDRPYNFIKVPSIPRERLEWLPKLPFLRSETGWEEASFAPGLLARYRPGDFDITATCAFPFTNFVLRRRSLRGGRPPHVFITQNGDWPAYSRDAEYRLFDCDGLVCINPDYQERNRDKYRTSLVPNGADLTRFRPGPPERERLGLPPGKIVLMVSALIPSKNVADGVRAVAALDDATLVVAGDGPLRNDIEALAAELLPSRYRRISVDADDMPALYRSVDAFLHLSRDESFGNVFVEALACGVPSVVFDLPRTRWILGDQAYYAPHSIEGIVSQLTRARADGGDLVAGRVERAKAFGWPVIAAKYRDFFAEIIDSNGRSK